MDDCIFCKIIKGEIPSDKVYEDGDFFAFLDIRPINPGHTLLISKNHYENIYAIPEELMAKAGPLIKKLAIAIKKATEADGINLGMNNGRAAGQLVFHAHFHIMPRHNNDGYVHWGGREFPSGKAKEMASKITQAL